MAFYFRVVFNDINNTETVVDAPVSRRPSLPSIPEEELPAETPLPSSASSVTSEHQSTSSEDSSKRKSVTISADSVKDYEKSDTKDSTKSKDKSKDSDKKSSGANHKSESIKIKIKNGDVVHDIKKDKSEKSKSKEKVENVPTIKLKLDMSNKSVSIVSNTTPPSTSQSKSELKSELKLKKKLEKLEKKKRIELAEAEKAKELNNKIEKKQEVKESENEVKPKKDEYEFEDDVDQQKLGFLNTFELIRKPNKPHENKTSPSVPSVSIPKLQISKPSTSSSVSPSTSNVAKRKSKEPVKIAPKKYKSNEMKTVTQGDKFLAKKMREGKEITFDLSPKPLGSKPAPAKITMEMIQAEKAEKAAAEKAAAEKEAKEKFLAAKAAAEKAMKIAAERSKKTTIQEPPTSLQQVLEMTIPQRFQYLQNLRNAISGAEKTVNSTAPSMPSLTPNTLLPVMSKLLPPKIDSEIVKKINIQPKKDEVMKPPPHISPIKPKKLPVLLPKPIESLMNPPSMVPLLPKPKNSEISVMKINDTNGNRKVFGPNSNPNENFLFPMPPKPLASSTPKPAAPKNPLPVQTYGNKIKQPKHVPANMVTPYGMRTPYYTPSSPSYSPDSPAYSANYGTKPQQHKYTNPSAYASFMHLHDMYKPNHHSSPSSPPPLKPVSPVHYEQNPTSSNNISRKRSVNSPDSNNLPAKRKTPSPTQKTDDPKTILNNISFPSSLSVTLTNEQEDNVKEQIRNLKQTAVNNNIEIIKLLPDVQNNEEKRNGKSNNNKKSPSPPPLQQQSKASADNKETAQSKNATTAKSNSGGESKSKKPVPISPAPATASTSSQQPILPKPIVAALSDPKESFQKKFLESIIKSKEEKLKEAAKRQTETEPEKAQVTNEKVEQKTSPQPFRRNSVLLPPPQNPRIEKAKNTKPSTIIDLSGASPDKKKLTITSSQSQAPPKNPPKLLALPTQPPVSPFPPQIAHAFANAAMMKMAMTQPEHIEQFRRQLWLEQLRQNVERSQALLALQIQQQTQNKNSSSK